MARRKELNEQDAALAKQIENLRKLASDTEGKKADLSIFDPAFEEKLQAYQDIQKKAYEAVEAARKRMDDAKTEREELRVRDLELEGDEKAFERKMAEDARVKPGPADRVSTATSQAMSALASMGHDTTEYRADKQTELLERIARAVEVGNEQDGELLRAR